MTKSWRDIIPVHAYFRDGLQIDPVVIDIALELFDALKAKGAP